ncbi:MAG: NAD-dependent deacylase [Acidobacteria bacterium]|nr:NAD-dependent deacylase [Acidobacteriota bacterium]
MRNSGAIAELEAALSGARSVCVLTGAGVSAESGIPTFRGPDGLWRKYRIEELATPEAFARDPILVWEWYAWRREIMHNAQPNPAHYALAELEDQFALRPGCGFTLVTQNVDGPHERAGSRNILRLHGSVWQLRCVACGAEREDRSVPLDPFPPRCACGSMMRPAVVWFGETLPEAALQQSIEAAAAADLFLVVGTSALVYPAASLPLVAQQKGARLIEINPDPTPLSDLADLTLTGKAGEILGALRPRRQEG